MLNCQSYTIDKYFIFKLLEMNTNNAPMTSCPPKKENFRKPGLNLMMILFVTCIFYNCTLKTLLMPNIILNNGMDNILMPKSEK